MLVAQRELEGLVRSRAPEVRIGDAVSLAIRAERCDESRRLEEARGLGVVAGARECGYRQGWPAIVGSIWQGDRFRRQRAECIRGRARVGPWFGRSQGPWSVRSEAFAAASFGLSARIHVSVRSSVDTNSAISARC